MTSWLRDRTSSFVSDWVNGFIVQEGEYEKLTLKLAEALSWLFNCLRVILCSALLSRVRKKFFARR